MDGSMFGQGGSASRDEVLGLILLFAERLRERGYARDDAADHEEERDDGPDDAPALRRAAVPFCEDAGVGAVHFSQDEIIALQKRKTPGCQHEEEGGGKG